MENIKMQLSRLNKNNMFVNKYLIAIGRLEHIKQIQSILSTFNISLNAIVDNDKKKQGICINDIQVYAPEALLIPFKDDRLILIYSPKYWREILQQFEEMGYNEDRNIIVLNKPTLKNNIKSIYEGYKLYCGLQKEFSKQVSVFVCSCPLGDFYLLGLYFSQYIETNNIKSYVVVGNSKGILKLSRLFKFSNVKQLSDDETNLLINLYSFAGKDLKLKILSIWQGALRFNSCKVRQQNGFTFMDTFKYYVYNLEQCILPKIPEFDLNIDIDKYENNGFVKDRTVILAPFSYSMQSLPITFWQQLSDNLKDRGYSVVVNVDEARENNLICGTETLNSSLEESIYALEYAGTIIGIRSGFFDVTSSANCKRIVLYPKKIEESSAYNWNCTDLEFNSLNAMELCNDAIEIEFPICNEKGQSYIYNNIYDEKQCEILLNCILDQM